MLLDIIMESLKSMDDETLNAALESMDDEELDIVNNYIDNSANDGEQSDDDAYADALEATVYELNSMDEEDVAAVLESLDEDTVADLMAMENFIFGAMDIDHSKANEATDIVQSIRNKILAHCE